MHNNSNNCVLVQDLSGINSPTFIDKKSDNALSIYKVANCFNLHMNSTPSEIVINLSNDMNCNPDGWLIFISTKYQEKISELIKKEFLNAYNNDILNFDNGERSETILYHNINIGMIIELIDPECGSEFFYALIDKIQEFMDNNNLTNQDLLFFELHHMASHVCELKDENNGAAFLNMLDNNNIKYFSE